MLLAVSSLLDVSRNSGGVSIEAVVERLVSEISGSFLNDIFLIPKHGAELLTVPLENYDLCERMRLILFVFVYRVSALLDDLVVRRGTKRVSIRFTASMENASSS